MCYLENELATSNLANGFASATDYAKHTTDHTNFGHISIFEYNGQYPHGVGMGVSTAKFGGQLGGKTPATMQWVNLPSENEYNLDSGKKNIAQALKYRKEREIPDG